MDDASTEAENVRMPYGVYQSGASVVSVVNFFAQTSETPKTIAYGRISKTYAGSDWDKTLIRSSSAVFKKSLNP